MSELRQRAPKFLSFLQPRMIVIYDGREHCVISVNDSRAVIRAIERKIIAATEEKGARTMSERDIGISPNSEIEIVGYADDALWAQLNPTKEV